MATQKPPLPNEAQIPAVSARLSALFRAVRELYAPDKKMTAKTFVERAGLTTNQWSNFMANERRINLEDAIRLSLTYGTTLDFIYLGEMSGVPLDLAEEIRRQLKPVSASVTDMALIEPRKERASEKRIRA